MPVRLLKEYLDRHGIKYVTISHRPAYTAQKVAASAHVPGQELAKTVMVKVDGKMAMAVLPASTKVEFEKLRDAIGAESVRLATEREFRTLFPECDVGAMPPFGNLYGMDVYVAERLTEDREIAFSAGTHRELLKMAYADFEALVRPKVIRFARTLAY